MRKKDSPKQVVVTGILSLIFFRDRERERVYIWVLSPTHMLPIIIHYTAQ